MTFYKSFIHLNKLLWSFGNSLKLAMAPQPTALANPSWRLWSVIYIGNEDRTTNKCPPPPPLCCFSVNYSLSYNPHTISLDTSNSLSFHTNDPITIIYPYFTSWDCIYHIHTATHYKSVVLCSYRYKLANFCIRANYL